EGPPPDPPPRAGEGNCIRVRLARVWRPAWPGAALLRPKRAADPQPSTVGAPGERAGLSRDRPRQPRVVYAAASGASVASTLAAGPHCRDRVDRGADGGGVAVERDRQLARSVDGARCCPERPARGRS